MIPLVLFLVGCARPTQHTLPLAVEVADAGVHRWSAENLPFDWIPTVWGYGVDRLYHATGDDTLLAYDEAWMAPHVAPYAADPPATFVSSDSMSPALVASAVMADDGTADLEPITQAADAYLATAPRTRQGAIEHWTADAPFGTPDQVWVDSQFMFGMFLLEQATRLSDADHLETFTSQYALFSQLLRDPDTQLYRHAYDDDTGQDIPQDAVFWARGNAWVLVAAAEAIDREGIDDPALSDLVPAFQAQAEAVIAVQDASDGLWHTVLNAPRGPDPANYTETSASALIAYALVLGARSGALPKREVVPVVARALDGIRGRITYDADGVPVVHGTSLGTDPGDYDYYTSIDRGDDLMLGVGAVVMLLTEADGFPAESR